MDCKRCSKVRVGWRHPLVGCCQPAVFLFARVQKFLLK